MNEKITLSIAENKLASFIGEARHISNRNAGIVDNQVSNLNEFEMDINAIGAEIAFAKLVNIYPDLEIHPQSLTWDCTLLGKKIDVKQTESLSNNLITKLNKKDSPIDIYVLMCGKVPEFTFKGWTTKKKFINDNNIRNLGYGDTYFLHQSELNQLIHELYEYCSKPVVL